MTPYRFNTYYLPHALGVLLAACFSMQCAVAQAAHIPAAHPAATPSTQTQPYVDPLPHQPLDARIKADKITQSAPAPLPERIILPMPPTFRISDQASQVPIDPQLWQRANDALVRGTNFLLSRQDARGAWMADAKAAPTDQPDRASAVSLAVTSLAVKALVQADPAAVESAHVLKALQLIAQAQNADGSFDNSALANYVTSAVLMALASVEDSDHRDLVADAVQSLQRSQWDQSEGLNARQDWFGGAGYGNHGRPDLSNTQMMLDALYDAGLSPDEPAFQKAIAFASRTQNLQATNQSEWAGNDGGFIYTAANGGESMASEAAGEGRYGEKLAQAEGHPRSLRSYGSMTYAGFKSMLYAGLSQDDVRVRAAFDWVRTHWTFDENPGMGQQGLYYYYHTMARALTIAQQHVITDANGVKHNWREELIEALLKRQREDGSWVNEADRWMEGEPSLVTSYALLALEEALKPVVAR